MLKLKDFLYLGVITVLLLALWRGCDKPADNTEIKKPVYEPTTQKTDKQGTTYTEIKGTLYTESQMKAVTDSLRKVLGKGKVIQVTSTVTDIDTFLKQDTLFVNPGTGMVYAADSSKDIKISYIGNYLVDTGSFHLDITPDTATYVTTVEKRFLRSDILRTNIYHTNDLFHPSEGYTYTTRAAKVIAVLGPCIGGGYATGSSGLQGFVGASLTFNLIPIKSRR